MSGASCELTPKVKVINSQGTDTYQDSELYKELSKLIKHRPTTNLIYAYYLQSGVEAQMDSQAVSKKYKKNHQGQYRGRDVYDFFNVAQMINESTEDKISFAEKTLGVKDAQGNYVLFDDVNQALTKAADFNKNNNALVAYVTIRGDKYSIIVDKRDSRTNIKVTEPENMLQLWNIINSQFNQNNLDLQALETNDLTSNIANPISSYSSTGLSYFLEYLNNLKTTENKYLSQRDIYALIALNKNTSQQVQRLLTKYGDLETVSLKIYNYIRGIETTTSTEMSLIQNTLSICRQYNGIDLNRLNSYLESIQNNNIQQDYNMQVQETLKDLNKKYNIDINEIHLQGNKIKRLSEAVASAVISLQRQLDKEYRLLQNIGGDTTKIKRIEATIQQLSASLNSKKYYMGSINFLKEANDQLLYINDLLQNINRIGTVMEKAVNQSKVYTEVKGIIDNYYDIINILSKIDKIKTDENLSDIEIQNILNEANSIKKQFDNYRDLLNELKSQIATDVVTEILGDQLPNGEPIANILSAVESDGSVADILYSFGKTSNPLINVMGKITRDAQDERDKQLEAIRWRIENATKKLYKAGFNSKFMYESTGYIISDINWNQFYAERNFAIKQFKSKKLKGIDLSEAIRQWDEEHTVERIVDTKTGRTEKVPDNNYRKPFPTLAPEQQEYYNEMMQIKGEMGTLLPQYMQKHYLPPQKRRSFMDAIASARSIKDIVKAIKEKIGDGWKIREDDTYYTDNGVIDGEDYAIGKGSFTNTLLRKIPIFYVREIHDGNELLKDFSSALQSFASTAINYNCMNEVLDLIETLRDYISDLYNPAMQGDNKIAEITEQQGVRVIKDLINYSKDNNCMNIIEGFISKQFFGENLINAKSRVNRIIKAMLKYTSINALSVNVKGMINNLLGGEWQLLLEAGAGEYFNFKDYLWAQTMIFGETFKAPGKLIDFLNNDRNSYDVLISDIFDPEQSNYAEASSHRYYKSKFRRLFSVDFTFMGYRIGEYIIHKVGMYAVLHNVKVYDQDGNKMTLYDAFDKIQEDGKTKLVLKSNLKDAQGNIIDEAYIDNIKKRIRQSNQSMFGSMNEEDKGVIHQRIIGRCIMNLRQWMVEFYSKRYRQQYWDSNTQQWREGSYVTLLHAIQGIIEDHSKFRYNTAIHMGEYTELQKANLRRVASEQVLVASLILLQFALGAPDDHEGEFWYRMWIYQTKRSLSEVSSGTPMGLVVTAPTIINSPIPATNTAKGWMYPIIGIGDITEEIKRGPYKGYNKYLINTARHTLPFYRQLDQLYRMDEDNSVYSVFEINNIMRQ